MKPISLMYLLHRKGLAYLSTGSNEKMSIEPIYIYILKLLCWAIFYKCYSDAFIVKYI